MVPVCPNAALNTWVISARPTIRMVNSNVRNHMRRIRRCVYKRNWITSRDGNVSIRHHDRDHFYITPSGVRKQTLQPDQFKKIWIKP
jgi:ribulose-5-phosphate 4-epimerase/fuculose-1-phosphate aldolase